MPSARLIETLGKVPLLSQALRWYARRYTEGSVVTIKSGEAAGFRWKRHHRYVNGYWLGQYELPLQQALKRELEPGDTFFDVGANAGFFTLIAARLVGPTGKCVAFDPAPANLASIREQIELNDLRSVTAVAEAISGSEGTATFSFMEEGNAMGHLGSSSSSEASITVPVTTFDKAAERFGRPSFIKMDIEGAEKDAIGGAKHLLQTIRPAWLIELHSPECERIVKGALRDAGYRFSTLEGHALNPDAELPHHFIARA